MIGVIGSGSGGLIVLKTLAERLPHDDFTFVGNTARSPYGSKSAKTVTKYVLESADLVMQQNARIVVIASHTASCVATDRLRAFLKVPVLDVVDPAVERAVQLSRSLRIGIIGDRTTIDSGTYQRKLGTACPEAQIFSAACPLLGSLVKEGWHKKSITRMIVKKYLHPLKRKQIDTLILGCTHYPLLAPIIQNKIGRRVNLIDPARPVSIKLADYLKSTPGIRERRPQIGRIRLFATDVTTELERATQTILGPKAHLQSLSELMSEC